MVLHVITKSILEITIKNGTGLDDWIIDIAILVFSLKIFHKLCKMLNGVIDFFIF